MLEILIFLVIFILTIAFLYYKEKSSQKDKMPFNIRKNNLKL